MFVLYISSYVLDRTYLPDKLFGVCTTSLDIFKATICGILVSHQGLYPKLMWVGGHHSFEKTGSVV